MGANTTRAKVTFVSNLVAANTGTTVATAVDNDVLLINRAGTVVSDTGTVISDINNDEIRVVLGIGAAGVVKYSPPIQVKNIRKVSTTLYEVPTLHSVKVVGANVVPAVTAAGTTFSIKVHYHDSNQALNARESEQFFYYTTLAANETSTTIFAALAAKINAVLNNKQVTATATADLVITGIAIANNSINIQQYRYFDVILRAGFVNTATPSFTITTATPTPAGTEGLVITPGKPGKGTGQQIRDLELTGMYDFNRTMFPVDTDTRRAIANTGYYNQVVIEYTTEHLSNFHNVYQAPQTLILAFFAAETTATTAFDGAGTPIASAKQAAFMTKLTSVVESADVFVA